jgi:uncharacterized protein YhjY with autotransporter beta-barrel domain
MKKKSTLILMALSFTVGAEGLLNFDLTSIINAGSNGFTSIGNNRIFDETENITVGDMIVGEKSYSYSPSLNAPYAAYLQANTSEGASINDLSVYLGIQSTLILNYLDPDPSNPDPAYQTLTPTNFAFLGKEISLSNNTNYSFYWATANTDYSPFSDGTFFALNNINNPDNILTNFSLLSRISKNPEATSVIPGETPGYPSGTGVLGSYGATDWIKKSFTVTTSGIYKIVFGSFNSIDTILSPILLVSDLDGEAQSLTENVTFLSFINNFPSPEDTNASLQLSARQLRGAYNSQVAASNLSLNHDCNLFDTKGLCISAGGRYTTIDNPTTNASAAVVSLGYKMNSNIRIGGFLDQNVNIQSPSSINIANKNPLMGLYAVWNKDTSGLGYQLRLANTYQDKDVTTTRLAYGDTGEAGSGTAKLNSQSYLAELSYAFQYQDKTLVRPYFGLRYTKLKRDGYSESSGAEYALTYDTLNDRSTTALMGARVNYQVTPKTTLTANLGIEQDLHHKVDNLTASNIDINDLTPIAFNSNIKRTRPVASVGAFYDVTQAQRLSGTLTYQQLPFQSTGATSLYVNYMIGF